MVFGRRLNLLANEEKFDFDDTLLLVRYKYVQNILEHFWKRWHFEYVTELREHHKCNKTKNLLNDKCNIGDVVQIHEDKTPRINFKVGVIERFKISSDGKRRVAIVKLCQNGKTSHLTRPINKLYPLEFHQDDDVQQVKVKFISDQDVQIIH